MSSCGILHELTGSGIHVLLMIKDILTLMEGHDAVAQLVEALRYKSESHGFDSR